MESFSPAAGIALSRAHNLSAIALSEVAMADTGLAVRRSAREVGEVYWKSSLTINEECDP